MGQPIAGSNPALSATFPDDDSRPCGAPRRSSAASVRPADSGSSQPVAAAASAFGRLVELRIIASMFDVIIEGGDLIDGTGAAPRRADVGISGGNVTAVDDLSAAEAERRIDATGLTVAPGFIDTHTHTEGVLLGDPQHAMGLCQGITTEIFGLDGLSYAPLSRANYQVNRRYLAGLLGWPPEDLETSTVAAFRQAYHRTVAINTAYLAAHGAIRLEALGFHDAPLVGAPLDHARRLVRELIEGGAVGISSGLNYYPNAWCDTDELVELAKATRDAGSIHVIELRTANRGSSVPRRRARRGDGGGPPVRRPNPHRPSPDPALDRRPHRGPARGSGEGQGRRGGRQLRHLSVSERLAPTRSATCRRGSTRAAPMRSSRASRTRPTAPGSWSTWTRTTTPAPGTR